MRRISGAQHHEILRLFGAENLKLSWCGAKALENVNFRVVVENFPINRMLRREDLLVGQVAAQNKLWKQILSV